MKVEARQSLTESAIRMLRSWTPFLRAEIEKPVMLSRSRYKSVWNSVSRSEEEAKMAVSGFVEEDRYVETSERSVAMLRQFLGISPSDVVLEIGAGVGRVGATLAPMCKEWIGVDVSENMLGHIARRLAAFKNVRTVATNGFDLSGVASESVDVVYSTVVFMHLDEWERYGYIKEGFRVLRPGGRMLVDNVDLTSDLGWTFLKSIVRCRRTNGRLRSARPRRPRSWRPILRGLVSTPSSNTGPGYGSSRVAKSPRRGFR